MATSINPMIHTLIRVEYPIGCRVNQARYAAHHASRETTAEVLHTAETYTAALAAAYVDAEETFSRVQIGEMLAVALTTTKLLRYCTERGVIGARFLLHDLLHRMPGEVADKLAAA